MISALGSIAASLARHCASASGCRGTSCRSRSGRPRSRRSARRGRREAAHRRGRAPPRGLHRAQRREGDMPHGDRRAEVRREPRGQQPTWQQCRLRPVGERPGPIARAHAPTVAPRCPRRQSDDAAGLLRPAASFCDPCGPIPRPLFVGDVDHRQPADALLGGRVGAVGDKGRAARRVGVERARRILVEAAREDVLAGGPDVLDDLVRERTALAEPRLGVVADLLLIEEDDVLRHAHSDRDGCPGPVRRLARDRKAMGG